MKSLGSIYIPPTLPLSLSCSLLYTRGNCKPTSLRKSEINISVRWPKYGHIYRLFLKNLTYSLTQPLRTAVKESDSVTRCSDIFSWIKPTYWPLIKKLKWFCWKIGFRGDRSEISDSALANTVRSKKMKFSKIQIY